MEAPGWELVLGPYAGMVILVISNYWLVRKNDNLEKSREKTAKEAIEALTIMMEREQGSTRLLEETKKTLARAQVILARLEDKLGDRNL